MFVSPASIWRNPNPQCNGIWRWGLREATRSGGWSPHAWDSCPHKSPRQLPCPLGHVRTQKTNQEAGPHQAPNLPDLDPSLPACRTVRNKCPLLTRHPVDGVLLQRPPQMKMPNARPCVHMVRSPLSRMASQGKTGPGQGKQT